jgi:hypothetical protein
MTLIKQSYSCTIRYFDMLIGQLVTWSTKISDDTLAFLFNKCNILFVKLEISFFNFFLI